MDRIRMNDFDSFKPILFALELVMDQTLYTLYLST